MAREQWYLRTQDETFGPETQERLLEWARMGRIQPGQEVSDDGVTWRRAETIPFLDMRWSIDIGDGQPRGPFNRAAAEALVRSGRLPPGSKVLETVPPFGSEVSNQESSDEPKDENVEEPDETVETSELVPQEDSAADDAEKVVEVPVEKVVEKIVEVPVEKIVEKRVEVPVEKIVEKIVEKVVIDEAKVNELTEALRQMKAEAEAAESRAEEARQAKAAAESLAEEARQATEAAESRAEQARQATAAAESMAAQAKEATAAAESRAEQARAEAQELSDEIKRIPPNAKETANAEAAVFAVMAAEIEDLEKAVENEKRDIDELRKFREARLRRLSERLADIRIRSGMSVEEMRRRALRAVPEDPRTIHLRREYDALRLLQERTARESEQRIRDLSQRLTAQNAESDRLRQQLSDVTVLNRQIQDLRARLQLREKELMETRQAYAELQTQYAAEQQTLLKRVSQLENDLPGHTAQSAEAHATRFPPWMGFKK